MKNILALPLILLLLACSPQTPQAELHETIDRMLLLIDQGKSQELLAQYADLSDTKGSVTEISESKLKMLRFFLLRAKEMKPVLSENGTLATFNDSSFKMPLKFTKSGDKWLLKNK